VRPINDQWKPWRQRGSEEAALAYMYLGSLCIYQDLILSSRPRR